MKEEEKSKRVVFLPDTYQKMQQGINQIVNAVRPTLGPLPRNVAATKVKPHDQLPEMLDSGGVIARRIYQLPDRDVDTGAMFIRQLLWRQHEYVGDGTATTAVLFQSIYNEALKFLVAGGNAMVLRHHLEVGLRIILEELDGMRIPVEERRTITHVANSVCFDQDISEALGDIFDILGIYGHLDIRSGRTRGIEREFVSGSVYEGGFHTALMVNDAENIRAQIEETAVFLSDLEIKEPDQIIQVVRVAAESGVRGLVVISRSISEKATGVLYAASRQPQKFKAIPIKTPGVSATEQRAFLEDIAVLTGGKTHLEILGDSPENTRFEDLGHARRIWADKNFTGIYGGKGDPIEIRRHVHELRGRYENVDDVDIRKLTLTRLGKLMGGSATLYVGGVSEIEINTRKEVTQRAVDAVRSALLKGVLPGGGAAFLACKPVLDGLISKSESLEEKVAYMLLSRAMEEPTRTILSNAGYNPSVYIARIGDAGIGYGFDVREGKVTKMIDAGILDSAGVILEALRGAVSSAALGLTVDTLIHRKRQKIANRP